MDGLRTELEKLVCSRETAERIVFQGIEEAAALWWYDSMKEDPEFAQVEPVYKVGLVHDEYRGSIPAWTYEELRVMVGHLHNGADFPEPRPKPMPGETQTFYVYYPDHCKQYQSGAQGTAEYLLWLLEEEKVTPEEVNERYKTKFKPQ